MRPILSPRHRPALLAAAVALPVLAAVALPAAASTPQADARLTNDYQPSTGYQSNYTMVTGVPYTDPAITECSASRGRQNEPSSVVNPRNPLVIIGSSNDYCAVYDNGSDADGAPIPSGPIWLGYYRSQNGGTSFQSSLVPGYPGDTSPYASRAQIRTASSGDPVLAWDGDGRLFAGSESSDDPSGTKKTFGDVWVATYENPAGTTGATLNDGKEFKRSVVVARGTSAPNLNGKFNDKTAIAADRTTNRRTRGNVYFAYSRFVGSGGSNIYFSRSTNHGVSFSQSALLTTRDNDVQFADIAINGDGTVTVTWVASVRVGGSKVDAVRYAVSRDGGATFSPARTLTTFEGYAAQDVPSPAASSAVSEPDVASVEAGEDAQGGARDCGQLSSACDSRYIFFRHDTQARSSADQTNPADHTVYVVLDPSVPGSEVSTGTTYGSIEVGTGSQEAVYAISVNPLTGAKSSLVRVRPETTGHQLFPDVAVEQGVVHVLWWDSRNDSCYSAARPIGNCADRSLVPSLDVFGATLDSGLHAVNEAKLTDVPSNPNWDQFSGRTVPFAGDYLWIDSAAGTTYGTWTDYRNTVAGNDPRTTDLRGDVWQCRTQLSDGSYTGDKCPRAGGLDQNIYGDLSP
ncbi:MAG: hypothetical protein QOJ90_938 [Actinomycetota bacterium]|nr:hypothetical protein [Actinomycetota bacterium]